jgi:class 3 adenylate cyclase
MPATQEPHLHLEIAHILFMDVVGYSKLFVNEQREMMQQLNQLVRKTAQFQTSEANGKLISIPSGDGMALVFFQSLEEPVQCALEIGRLLKNYPRLRLRMGVHSGPVDQIKDVNDRLNVAGAGINIAQRVMDCGDAGHILLSQRIAEDLKHYRQWQPQLHDLGECEVKHGVRIHMFNLYTGELGNPELPEKFRHGRRRKRLLLESIFKSAVSLAKGRWALIAAVLTMIGALAIGIAFFLPRSQDKSASVSISKSSPFPAPEIP